MNFYALQDHAVLMDRVYRPQSEIYDLTRRFFLLGRMQLLSWIADSSPAQALEIGSGTGWNLIRLARRDTAVSLYGLECSEAMLGRARRQINMQGLAQRIRLAKGLAENFEPQQLFGRQSFDVVFFSYVVSMLFDWRSALSRALSLTAPGGRLLILDFWDLHSYPALCRAGLRRWLELFHVRYDKEMVPFLAQLSEKNACQFNLSSIGTSYAWLACITRSPDIDRPVNGAVSSAALVTTKACDGHP